MTQSPVNMVKMLSLATLAKTESMEAALTISYLEASTMT
jgi:hypothetical protein